MLTTPEAAEQHFGNSDWRTPACQLAEADGGLLAMVRELEATVDRLTAEAMRADHARALREAEQRGYDKGLADGRAAAK